MPKSSYYKNTPFGFSSAEEFTQAVEAYARTPFISPEERQLLEAYLSEPVNFYLYVKSIFDRILELEQVGFDGRAIAEVFLSQEEERIYALRNLLEHGIAQVWGYNFIQDFLLARVWREYPEMRPKTR